MDNEWAHDDGSDSDSSSGGDDTVEGASELELIPASRWLSRGRGRRYARRMVRLQKKLLRYAADPSRMKEIDVTCGRDLDFDARGRSVRRDEVLQHDDALLPLWMKFADALLDYQGRIDEFRLSFVELHEKVWYMLLASLKGKIIQRAYFENINFGNKPLRLLTALLKRTSQRTELRLLYGVEALTISSIDLRDAHRHDVDGFKDQLQDQLSVLSKLSISDCGMHSTPFLSIFICTAIIHLDLSDNNLGRDTTKLLTNAIKKDSTHLQHLVLHRNNFDDKDALQFADALRQNNNITKFSVTGNRISDTGAYALFESKFGTGCLNTVASRTEFFLDLWLFPQNCLGSTEEAGRRIEQLQHEIWGVLSLKYGNDLRKTRIFIALTEDEGRCCVENEGPKLQISHLHGVPLGLMPEVLHFLQLNDHTALCLVFQALKALHSVCTYGSLPRKRQTLLTDWFGVKHKKQKV